MSLPTEAQMPAEPIDGIPHIWTSKGNVPADSLKIESVWDVQETYIKLALRYTDSTGELVREDAHVYSKMGLTGDGAVAAIA